MPVCVCVRACTKVPYLRKVFLQFLLGFCCLSDPLLKGLVHHSSLPQHVFQGLVQDTADDPAKSGGGIALLLSLQDVLVGEVLPLTGSDGPTELSYDVTEHTHYPRVNQGELKRGLPEYIQETEDGMSVKYVVTRIVASGTTHALKKEVTPQGPLLLTWGPRHWWTD